MTKSLKDGQYQYKETDFLGEGSFAKVYKGVIVSTKRTIAVRMLPLKLIKQYGNKIKQIISGEVCVLKELSEINEMNCLFTTKIYDCFLTEHNVTMILQFCPDGNLEEVVDKRGPIKEEEALEIAYQLALGLEFIAKRKVVHRDIKPDNIFIKKQDGYTIYKIGDFGFAVKKQLNDEIVGTPIFMSPELFREETYGSEVDVWAYGLLIHYLLFKEHFYVEASEAKVKSKVLTVPYSLTNMQKATISKNTLNLLLSCMEMNKDNRIKADKIYMHPAFQGCKQRVFKMMQDVTKGNQLTQSKLRGTTAKGQLANLIMSYNFIKDLSMSLGKLDSKNLATLYLLKYNTGQLYTLLSKIKNQQNVINHPGWLELIQKPEFKGLFGMLEKVFNDNLKTFEQYYNNLMNVVSNNYGPQVAQGICSNLGNGPYAPINVEIPIYELKNNWFSKLGTSPQEYLLKAQCLAVIGLLQKTQNTIDFCLLQTMKNNTTLQERSELIERGLHGK